MRGAFGQMPPAEGRMPSAKAPVGAGRRGDEDKAPPSRPAGQSPQESRDQTTVDARRVHRTKVGG